MDIRPSMTLQNLISQHPDLEETVTALLPELQQITQEPLRSAALAAVNVERMAMRDGRDVSSLIHDIKVAAGLEGGPVFAVDEAPAYLSTDPAWVQVEPAEHVDGVEMLSRGEHPLASVKRGFHGLSPGQVLLLTTTFPPTPLIEAMKSEGAEVHSREDARQESLFRTFLRR